MTRFIAVLLALVVSLTLASTASATTPTLQSLRGQLTKMVQLASYGGCSYAPTEGVKRTYDVLMGEYETMLGQFASTSPTGQLVPGHYLPNGTPTFDEARRTACLKSKAPKVKYEEVWSFPYQQYLYLLELASNECRTGLARTAYEKAALAYNRYSGSRPASLPARAPSLEKAEWNACYEK